MPIFPEREKPLPIEERADEISPLTIERKEVVSPVPTQFVGQVKSDKGQPLIQTPQAQSVSIQLPADPAQLTTLSKGSVNDSLTWLGAFWVRIIKKAIHFGWQILVGKKE
jgi:hypothetical protein